MSVTKPMLLSDAKRSKSTLYDPIDPDVEAGLVGDPSASPTEQHVPQERPDSISKFYVISRPERHSVNWRSACKLVVFLSFAAMVTLLVVSWTDSVDGQSAMDQIRSNPTQLTPQMWVFYTGTALAAVAGAMILWSYYYAAQDFDPDDKSADIQSSKVSDTIVIGNHMIFTFVAAGMWVFLTQSNLPWIAAVSTGTAFVIMIPVYVNTFDARAASMDKVGPKSRSIRLPLATMAMSITMVLLIGATIYSVSVGLHHNNVALVRTTMNVMRQHLGEAPSVDPMMPLPMANQTTAAPAAPVTVGGTPESGTTMMLAASILFALIVRFKRDIIVGVGGTVMLAGVAARHTDDDAHYPESEHSNMVRRVAIALGTLLLLQTLWTMYVISNMPNSSYEKISSEGDGETKKKKKRTKMKKKPKKKKKKEEDEEDELSEVSE